MNHWTPQSRLSNAFEVPAPVFLPGADASLPLGMPHLSSSGLSETWLLKELGHRHWTMLAGATGRLDPDFRDGQGHPVYAAFCALRIVDARFDRARENGRIAIRSALCRISRTQVLSRHGIELDDASGGAVEMVSTFIKRTGTGNHAVARVELDGLMPVDPAGSDLAALAAAFRTGRAGSHFGFDLSPNEASIADATFDPCPEQDFNGAGFLYFPSFLGFVDRAEWGIDRRSAPLRRRDAFYYGNIDPGDRLRVALIAERPEAGARWWRLERCPDRSLLADVFTQRG